MAKGGRSYEDVSAKPVKSFFVHMLTRDIQLSDAILDLLDNCVDGLLRKTKGKRKGDKPYKGFAAEITIDKDSFQIHDNCGGIPWRLHKYAFRMGRAKDDIDKGLATVGVYGIGMKRAIFKMGRSCVITTRSGQHEYEVEITREWVDDEEEWDIPTRPAKKTMKEAGTTILVGDLYDDVAAQFGRDRESFLGDFRKKVATHYAFIIDKGFEVKVNGEAITPKPTKLAFVPPSKGKGIRPFIYKTKTDGVAVFLAVGFTRPIPSEEEVEGEQDEPKYTSLDAGWTVVCNDRVVLYCNRDELTGWGEAEVPKYHTQFIAISGIVEFQSDDASKLPMTTTKRGIDATSSLYLQVKNKMREGMVIFTRYTNKWKGRELAKQSREHMARAESLGFDEIKKRARSLRLTTVKARLKGRQYKPSLPKPPRTEQGKRRIVYTKRAEEVEQVGEYVFPGREVTPSEVGEKCFDLMLREAR
ncbi:MAG: ATP-binding protein [Phycisphaerae bacterium]